MMNSLLKQKVVTVFSRRFSSQYTYISIKRGLIFCNKMIREIFLCFIKLIELMCSTSSNDKKTTEKGVTDEYLCSIEIE